MAFRMIPLIKAIRAAERPALMAPISLHEAKLIADAIVDATDLFDVATVTPARPTMEMLHRFADTRDTMRKAASRKDRANRAADKASDAYYKASDAFDSLTDSLL